MSRLLPPPSAPAWLGIGAAVAGPSTYVLLVVVARAVGPTEYSRFSLLWTAVVVASLGAFLPVEQVLARHAAAADAAGVRRLLAAGTRRAAVVGGLTLAVLAAAWVGRWGASGDAVAALTVTAFAVGGFVLQFPARGVLGGTGTLRAYAVVLVVDAGGRALAALALWVAGVTSVWPYAAAVAASALTCGVVGARAASRARPRASGPAATGTAGPAARVLAATIAAALSMQLLLNSAVVVAGAVATGAQAALAGVLLAVVVVARAPVFVFQSLQGAYVGAVARLAHARDGGLVRLLGRLAALVGATAAATLAVGALAGPALLRALFGEGYDVDRTTAAVAALGVACYLVASVTNDVAVALGEHRRLVPAWVGGVLVATLTAAVVPDLALRTTLPLVTGSATAAVVLAPAVLARLPRTAAVNP